MNDRVASLFTAQLLFLESENPKKEIFFYINSPGGLVTSGLGIYDTMQYIKSPVSTLCIGQASSMGSFLLAAGEKGKRFSLPNSRIMVHQPSAGFQGQATDIEIHANEVLSLKKRLNEIYSKHTGKSVEEIKTALERDNFMTPDAAKNFGLVDKVVPHDSLMDETMLIANRLAEGPSITLELTKKAVYHSLNVDLITQCDYEENLGAIVHNTEDNAEGRLAFREKRKPNFQGK